MIRLSVFIFHSGDILVSIDNTERQLKLLSIPQSQFRKFHLIVDHWRINRIDRSRIPSIVVSYKTGIGSIAAVTIGHHTRQISHRLFIPSGPSLIVKDRIGICVIMNLFITAYFLFHIKFYSKCRIQNRCIIEISAHQIQNNLILSAITILHVRKNVTHMHGISDRFLLSRKTVKN